MNNLKWFMFILVIVKQSESFNYNHLQLSHSPLSNLLNLNYKTNTKLNDFFSLAIIHDDKMPTETLKQITTACQEINKIKNHKNLASRIAEIKVG